MELDNFFGGRHGIHWFRHGLRLHDNPALVDTLNNCDKVYAVFIFDGHVAGTRTSGYNRWRFLHECLEDLDEQLRTLGSRLFVLEGDPINVFKQIFQEWDIQMLTFEQDPEPIWQGRDEAVKNLCKNRGVECIERISHTLWDPNKVIEQNGGSPPFTYFQFNNVVRMIGRPEHEVEMSYKFLQDKLAPVEDFDHKFALPPLSHYIEEPEYEEQMSRINEWKGGETEALYLLKKRLEVEVAAYSAGMIMPNQNKPDLVGPPTSLSPHLRFGCLSVRKFYWAIHDLYHECTGEPGNQGQLTAQLIWREYFYTMSVGNPNYNKIEENPICLQIPWSKNDEQLNTWIMGQTGYPWIDACMNQLRNEGWIHHVARHAVSCFLTRGDLWISWEDGLKVFDKFLLDADWSVCAGNWMWVSSSAFENCLQCPRCFSPIIYGMNMDPTGEYVRRYVPALKDMPLRYLFFPWKAPLEEQEAANCIIGKDYPMPMVDHKEASSYCRRQMENFKGRVKKDIIHCAPSDTKEVIQFCWLSESKCTADHLSSKMATGIKV